MTPWDMPDYSGEPCFIIGGGPSVKGFDVNRLRGRGRVIGINCAYTIAPWCDVLYFADKRWHDWNAKDLTAYEGNHIVTRAKITGNVVPIHTVERVRDVPLSRERGKVAGWCGGANALNIAALLGCNPIILLGYDMRPGNWHDLHRKPHKEGQHRDKFRPHIERMAPELLRDGISVFNTNPRSALRCFPFIDIEELLEMDDLTTIERDKYRQIWDVTDYRKISPGAMETQRAYDALTMKAGDRLIDFGAGTGRASAWFQDKRLGVIAFDIASNASEHPEVPFVEGCLWDLPDDLPVVDYAFCCDVMEHIPPQKVTDVMAGIANQCGTGAYFRIATRPDNMGKRIGKPLHLTVQNGEWWRAEAEKHFEIVDVISDNGRDVVMVCRH